MGAALGLDPLDTADLIDAATASGAVAIAADGSIGFPHQLIRAYFLDRLGAQASKVARTALLEAHVARDEMGAAARHAEVLGDDIAAERRFAVLVPAARDALDEGATEDAHRWAHLALSLGPPDGPLSSDDIDRHLVLGTVLVSLGSFVQARPVLLRTAEAARERTPPAPPRVADPGPRRRDPAARRGRRPAAARLSAPQSLPRAHLLPARRRAHL